VDGSLTILCCYLLGGKNHYAADREVADKVLAGAPSARTGPRENRAFLGRAVRFLAGEAGVRQFLNIGTGLPTTNNVHEVAQRIAPSSRIVYVDNDRFKSCCAHAGRAGTPDRPGALSRRGLDPHILHEHPWPGGRPVRVRRPGPDRVLDAQ
jgi:hypothetical protein